MMQEVLIDHPAEEAAFELNFTLIFYEVQRRGGLSKPMTSNRSSH